MKEKGRRHTTKQRALGEVKDGVVSEGQSVITLAKGVGGESRWICACRLAEPKFREGATWELGASRDLVQRGAHFAMLIGAWSQLPL